MIYAYPADGEDRYDAVVGSIRDIVSDMDGIFDASAAQTGGTRRPRIVTEATESGCRVVVDKVPMTAAGDDNFSNTASELSAAGFGRSDRKYLVFMDSNVICGQGDIWNDDSPGQGNKHNGDQATSPDSDGMVARVDTGCWDGHTAAHEITHNMGGVQLSAPNTSNGWHCVDEYDVMCYSDTPYFPSMRYECTNYSVDEFSLDCNKDDYFNTNPSASDYLATHWNVADSAFLERGGDSTPPSEPGAPIHSIYGTTAFSTGTVRARVIWNPATDAAGIADYHLWKWSSTTGTWDEQPLSPANARGKTVYIRPRESTQFAVSACDPSGNCSDFAYGPDFTYDLHRETSGSVAYAPATGSWLQTNSFTGALNSSLKYSSTAGATATFTGPMRNFAWFAVRGPGRGRARVYLDSALQGTIDLSSSSQTTRAIAWSKRFSSVSTHRVRVFVEGTSGRPRVDVDGFAVFR